MSFVGPKIVHYQGQDYNKIKHKFQKRTLLFEDVEFPADNSSISYSEKGKIPGIQWLRPPEISEDPHLFVNEANSRDITQGRVGNCWFVAACSSLANEKSLWKQIIPDHKEQDWDVKYPEKYVGIFHFCFWRFGNWLDIVIDDRLPTNNEGQLIFTHSRIRNEFWISLLEKAYAKLNGCYEALDGGNLSDALVDFTGGICENIELKPAASLTTINQSNLTPSQAPIYHSQRVNGTSNIDGIPPATPSPPQNNPFEEGGNGTEPSPNPQQQQQPINTNNDNIPLKPIESDYVKDKFLPVENPFDTNKSGRRDQTCEGDRYNCSNFEERKALFKVLIREMNRKSLMCAAIDVSDNSLIETRTPQGLIRGHAYAITQVKKLFTKDTSIIDFSQLFKFNKRLGMWKRKIGSPETTPSLDERKMNNSISSSSSSSKEIVPDKFYMIRLKNPWGGKNEWTGPFSDSSPEWEKITSSQREKLGLIFEDDGEFWMTFDDFCQNFTHLSICYVLNTSYLTFGKTWCENIIWSKWINGPYASKIDRAGGCVNFESFLQNPQCLLTLHDESMANTEKGQQEILFYLTQKDRREFKMYEKSQNLTIGFSIFKVEENRIYRIHDVRQCQKIGQSDYINSRSIFLRCFLPSPANYLILPTTFKPKEEGDFMFRLYSQSSSTEFKIAKLDYPRRNMFSGCFGYPNIVYRLHLKHATALEKQERAFGRTSTDPYALIICEKYKLRSKVIQGTLNPVWNQTFIFYCKHRNSPIKIEIWNSNMMRDTFMGQVEIHPTTNEESQNLELSLLGRKKETSEPMPGTISIQITATQNVKTFF